jgi:hypothetical protein
MAQTRIKSSLRDQDVGTKKLKLFVLTAPIWYHDFGTEEKRLLAVELLVRRGANVNKGITFLNECAIQVAALNDHFPMLKKLVDLGARIPRPSNTEPSERSEQKP